MSDFDAALQRAATLLQTDPQLRDTIASDEVLAFLRDEEHPGIEYVAYACKRYADRPCLGTRDLEGPPRFETLSYRQLWDRVCALAGGWFHQNRVRAGDFVGICGFASTDWVVADLACLYLGAISVPLQSNLAAEELAQIATETELACLVCSADQLDTLRGVLESCATLRSVTVIDVRLPDEVDRGWGGGQKTRTIEEVEAIGRTAGPVAVGVLARGSDPLVTVMYTSGSTGAPKGVTHRQSSWVNRVRYVLLEVPVPGITVGYLPLCHVTGRFNTYRALMRGGVTHFVPRSDMSTLFEDIRIVRPTVMTLMPRVSGMIYQHFQSQLVKRGNPGAEDAGLAETIRAEMRHTFLGDRLCLIETNAAPTAPEVLIFLERCFQVSIRIGYGFSELGLVTINDRVQPGVAYKLVDVPELGYSFNDRPFPRGELLVKTAHATPGYFKNADASERLRDPDGFLHSGDIMEERGPGHLVWIDRKHNVVKLSQGEFVSISRLEELFATSSPFIEQIYLYGNALRAYLLAVVVPNAEAVSVELARRPTADGDREIQIKRLLRSEVDRVSKGARLPSHEVPRDFVVEPAPFTKENGLLTEANKPRRPALKAAYGARLEARYAQIESRQVEGKQAAEGASTNPVAQRVGAAIATALGLSLEELDSSRSFVGLGGDSLSAVRLCSLLEDACGAAPSVGEVLDPSTSLAAIVRKVEELQGAQADRPTFDRIHGKGAQRVDAAQLRVESFLPAEVARAGGRRAEAEPSIVLLTGATGFLGRFLLLELLQRVTGRAGQVVCLVRGTDDASARARLVGQFAKGGAELLHRFQSLTNENQLVVHAGDQMQARLGLPDRIYEALAGRVDAVLHNGALVNHGFSYAQLFEPNVLGTVEVMRFCLEGRRKAIHFVSSSGVAAGLNRPEPILESEDAASLWPSRGVGSGPGEGYATSKWASEVLLRDLHQRCGIPVTVHRCGMVLPHRSLLGQINEDDNISRLLFGVITTGLAPASFYDPDFRLPRHFDGIPVDVVAATLAGITMQNFEGYRTFHVSNGHWDDGVSLDRIVDWVESAGHPLVRIASYDDWLARFTLALARLDLPLRRRSPLPLIERWAQPMGAVAQLQLDNRGFREKLRAFTSDDDVSVIDEAFVHHWVRGSKRG